MGTYDLLIRYSDGGEYKLHTGADRHKNIEFRVTTHGDTTRLEIYPKPTDTPMEGQEQLWE